jgi:VanZ family protein
MPGLLKAVYDFPGGDKVGHVVIYGALAFVLAAAFTQPIRIGRKTLPLSVLVLIAVTVAEEFSQSRFSARTFDLLDLACSLAGIALGAFVASRMFGKSKAPIS